PFFAGAKKPGAKKARPGLRARCFAPGPRSRRDFPSGHPARAENAAHPCAAPLRGLIRRPRRSGGAPKVKVKINGSRSRNRSFVGRVLTRLLFRFLRHKDQELSRRDGASHLSLLVQRNLAQRKHTPACAPGALHRVRGAGGIFRAGIEARAENAAHSCAAPLRGLVRRLRRSGGAPKVKVKINSNGNGNGRRIGSCEPRRSGGSREPLTLHLPLRERPQPRAPALAPGAPASRGSSFSRALASRGAPACTTSARPAAPTLRMTPGRDRSAWR